MNLNRFHKSIGRKRNLTRKDIEDYKTSTNPEAQNSIEQTSQSSSFDADAMEGWESISYDTSVMQSLDKRFSKPSNNAWVWIGGATVISLVVLILIFNQGAKEEQLNIAQVQTETTNTPQPIDPITIEETDIITPENIEKLRVVPEVEQVQPAQIILDFEEMNQEEGSEPTTQIHESVDSLPLIQQPSSPHIEFVSNRFNGKEIYLHDFKLIDYTKYRSKPSVQTKQFILSGTPANREERGQDEFETSEEVIEIPYIDYIDKTMRIFNRGNFKKALSRFEVIFKTYPDDINANFYAGLCLFNFGEYAQATTHFDKCMNTEYTNFDEEALWLKGLCFEHLGKTDKARQIFKSIEKSGGFYKDQAKEKLK